MRERSFEIIEKGVIEIFAVAVFSANFVARLNKPRCAYNGPHPNPRQSLPGLTLVPIIVGHLFDRGEQRPKAATWSQVKVGRSA